jgi:ceramide glucosyltransferase
MSVAAALVTLTGASWGYWLLALALVRRHVGGPPALPAATVPPVSILKPVRGVDPDACAGFESFFRLDYPAYELVFGVADPADPVLPLLEVLRAAHPGVPSRIVVAPAPGPNRKASLLEALAREARFDVLVATDADIRVAPAWLREVTAALDAPGVGLVTCPYVGAVAGSLPAHLEALHMGVTFLPSAVVASHSLGVPFAMGSTMALRRSTLDAAGGFAPLAQFLADDYQLGARVAALGQRVVLAREVVASALGRTTFREQWDRELRWARCTRASRPAGHAGYALTFSLPLALAFLVASGLEPAGFAAVAGSLVVRWTAAAGIARATRDHVSLRALLLVPLRDLLTAAIWAAGFVGGPVIWRGERFAVDGEGRLHPLAHAGALAWGGGRAGRPARGADPRPSRENTPAGASGTHRPARSGAGWAPVAALDPEPDRRDSGGERRFGTGRR